MGELSCQFVRPDRVVFDGPVASLVLVTYAGELGILPGHAPEICALGDGVVRIRNRAQDGGGEVDVVVSGGYAEVNNDQVIILADHARRTDDIDPDVVRETRDAAIETKENLDAGNPRHAYYENKIKWCNLLLKQALGDGIGDPR